MIADSLATRDVQFELRFGSLFDPGRAFAFPCDASGHVRLDRLPQRQQQSFQRVLQLVGREFASPVIAPAA